jgi:GT2 family glycosyltransferase
LTVAVVIVSHDSGDLLCRCVGQVLDSSIPVVVTVSDNASQDGSLAAIDRLAAGDGRLRVIRNGANLGFAAANNVALRDLAVDIDAVLFLNPDCLVERRTIETVAAALAAEPAAGMAGCLIRTPDGHVEPNCRRPLPTPLGLLTGFRRDGAAAADDPPVALTEAISGAFMLVRRSDLECIGSFDDGYFMHWEDLDLCRRFADAGRRILFVSSAEVVHHKGHCSRRRWLFVDWCKHRGLLRYLGKFHFTGVAAIWLLPAALALGLRFASRVPALWWRSRRTAA